MKRRIGAAVAISMSALIAAGAAIAMDDHPLTDRERAEIARRQDLVIEQCTGGLKERPDDMRLLLARGSAYFHRGRFRESLADFDRVATLDPQAAPQLWQRGITLYFLKRFDEAAMQFEKHHPVNNTDRENGIWHYMCVAETRGTDAARRSLFVYQDDNRAPFPDLYGMFQGELTGEQVLEKIRSAVLSDDEREKRLFYAHLYVGYYGLAHKDKKRAITHLREAVANRWGKKSGSGPGYMWHVARVQYEVLFARPEKQAGAKNG